MPVIQSEIDVHGTAFAQNRETMLATIAGFREVEQKVLDKANEAKAKFEKRGQFAAPRAHQPVCSTPAHRFWSWPRWPATSCTTTRTAVWPAAALIAGIGYIQGVRSLVIANNSAIKGGTISPSGLKKSLRLQQIAFENKLPVVTLAESGGANLNYAAEIFVEGARGFANQARMSAMGLPQITVVHGSSTAGGAYQPGLSDYVVVVRGKAKMFLAGPPLLKAATGEVATDEELGGAEMHAQVAGTAEYLAENDADGVRIAREIVGMLPWNAQLPAPVKTPYQEPLYPAEELLGIVPNDAKKPYDVREIITRIADGSVFLDFKNEFDNQTVCGHLAIEGQRCGFIGNNGPITPKGAAKAAQFIQLCEQSNTPILFFHNTTGFMVGTESEQKRRDQARLQADPGRGQLQRAQADHRRRRLLWRRQLRHVRPWSGPTLYLRLAQQQDRRNGRCPGRQGAAHRYRGQAPEDGPNGRPKDARHAGNRHRAETRQPVDCPVRHRQPMGRRPDRPT